MRWPLHVHALKTRCGGRRVGGGEGEGGASSVLACRGERTRALVEGAAGRQEGRNEGETTTEGACRGVEGCVGGVVGWGRRKACVTVLAMMKRNGRPLHALAGG